MMKNNDSLPTSQRSNFANETELTADEQTIVGSETGREDTQGAASGELAADDIDKPIGARPRSAETSGDVTASSGDENDDGLTDAEEMARHVAEDLPTGASGGSDDEVDDDDNVPVFDRADPPARI